MSLDGVGEGIDAIEEVLVLRRKVLEHQLHFCVLVRLPERALRSEKGEVGARHILI